MSVVNNSPVKGNNHQTKGLCGMKKEFRQNREQRRQILLELEQNNSIALSG